MASTPSANTAALPLPIAITGGTGWLVGTVFLSALIYYFVGVDQGAFSMFGNDTHVHEFVHDARHLLGFPCH
jgi:hypothetical protein